LFKFWTLCIFEPPLGGLGTTYDAHLWLSDSDEPFHCVELEIQPLNLCQTLFSTNLTVVSLIRHSTNGNVPILDSAALMNRRKTYRPK